MGAPPGLPRRLVLHDGASSLPAGRTELVSGGRPSAGVALRSHYLTPGDVHVADEPCVITTIVGSCVAVCLADRLAGVGGMNHFVLPESSVRCDSGRYGPFAMRQLIDTLLGRGARKERLEAKVFGGASIFGGAAMRANQLGSKNVRVAHEVLGCEGIPVVAADVEGHHGRKIIFHTHDGTAWVRRL